MSLPLGIIISGATFSGGSTIGAGSGGASFTLSSADFTSFGTGGGVTNIGNTGFSISGSWGTTQAYYYANLGSGSGGNPAKSAEILAIWTANGLTLNGGGAGGSYMFDVSWGAGSSTNTTRNVVVLRFDYTVPNSTSLVFGTVDTNIAGWDTPGQDPYTIPAANGTFLLPATFTLIRPTIEDIDNWC
jgi:hypothetical protein